jgi:uncharacterized protein YceK
MKRPHILLAAVIMLILPGCALINKRMSSWEGHHYSELIRSWGAPSRVVDDGAGGKVIVYEEYVDLGTSGRVDQWGNFHAQNNGYTRKREFFADRDGIIRRWQWHGL